MLEETKKRGFHLQEGWRRYIIYLNQPINQRALLKFSRKQSFECAFMIKAQFDQSSVVFLPFTTLAVSYNGRGRYLIHYIYNISSFCRQRFFNAPSLLQLQLWCNFESGLFCWFHFFSLLWDLFRFPDLPANRFWCYRPAWKGKLLVLIWYDYM